MEYITSEMTFSERMAERFKLSFNQSMSEREKRLCIFKKVYDGTLYDALTPYSQNYTGGKEGNGDYIPVAQRRPSIIYPIPKIIVEESVSMLFGESHFPLVRCEEEENTNALAFLINKYNLRSTMICAAKIGSLGSVCLLVKVLNKKFYVDVLNTQCLTPVFDRKDPGVLAELKEKKIVMGATLSAYGYDIDDKNKNKPFYLRRVWNKTEEIYYVPYLCSKENDKDFKLTVDKEKSTDHSLGFVPAIWIKNNNDGEIDGECTFESIVDILIEINYQLSQLGRLLKYNADPTLVIKNEDSMSGGPLIKGQTLKLGDDGEAYLLEMKADGANAVIDYVRALREFAIEAVRGNRANPDKISALHSGKALQMLNIKLLSFVEDLRLFYGDCGLKPLLAMMVNILKTGKYTIDTGDFSLDFSAEPMDSITLEWPDFYPPTPDDDANEANALQIYQANGILSKQTIRRVISDKYNILDVQEEEKQCDKEEEKNDKKELTKQKKYQILANNKSQSPAGAGKSKSVVAQDN